MAEIDANASVSESVLIERAGWHVARVAKTMMGGSYGRHVVVVAVPGNNGADGKIAAQLLSQRGAIVEVLDPDHIDVATNCDLVIDAAYGTGFHGEYKAPIFGSKVLAVDIPSGVDGDTGIACGGAVHADVTVTFAAYKPGHFINDGPEHCGHIELCDIGLDTESSCISLVELSDLRNEFLAGRWESHKWKTAIAVVAGSPGMLGSAQLVSAGAARAGAGMVRLLLPGVDKNDLPITEAVASSLPAKDWAKTVEEMARRVHVLVIGPGLGRDDETVACVRQVVERLDIPMIIDADALFAIADKLDILKRRTSPTLLTPHAGEFKRLSGETPSENRFEQVRRLAKQTNCTVLLKGSTTLVSRPDGEMWVSNTGSTRLATAGTGDVLAGVIGAFMARHLEVDDAAAFGSHIHGLAAQQGMSQGLVAGDLPELIAHELSKLVDD